MPSWPEPVSPAVRPTVYDLPVPRLLAGLAGCVTQPCETPQTPAPREDTWGETWGRRSIDALSETPMSEQAAGKRLFQQTPGASKHTFAATGGAPFGKAVEARSLDTSLVSIQAICADYFENAVAPMFRKVQEAQDDLNARLKELERNDTSSVGTLARLQEISSTGMLVRLQELEATLFQQKVNANQGTSLAELSYLEHKLDSKVGKMQVVVAAAGASFDGQIKDLRKQVDRQGAFWFRLWLNAHGSRERDSPCRKTPLWGASLTTQLLDASPIPFTSLSECDAFSERDTTCYPIPCASDPGSISGSMWEGSEEPCLREREEIVKCAPIDSPAGSVLSRDLRDMRRQVQEHSREIEALKQQKAVTLFSF